MPRWTKRGRAQDGGDFRDLAKVFGYRGERNTRIRRLRGGGWREGKVYENAAKQTEQRSGTLVCVVTEREHVVRGLWKIFVITCNAT
ncbi:uncharacterized protein LOC105696766 isoform X2 [Orussus abietinus]|nr:uncharacterized protein LOC105696766 isoform X2 [Orussus abietinus]